MDSKRDFGEVGRLIDANLNRLREGLRVVEDIARYLYDERELSLRLKELRHNTKILNQDEFIDFRDISLDVLKDGMIKSESDRDEIKDIVIANFKRAEESARVLEESTKILDIKCSGDFKKLRYKVYELEKIYLTKYFKKDSDRLSK